MELTLNLTAENITTELQEGDVFVDDDVSPVRSVRLARGRTDVAVVYFIDDGRDFLGLPQTVKIERESRS